MEWFLLLLFSCTAPGVQLWFGPPLCVCVCVCVCACHLRHLFPTQMRESENSVWVACSDLLRPAATIGVCTNCLWWCRPEGSCNRWGHACPGGTPCQCPERQGLVCGVGTVMTLAFACYLTMEPRFLGRTHFLQLAFPASDPLAPVLSVLSVKPTAILSQDPLP